MFFAAQHSLGCDCGPALDSSNIEEIIVRISRHFLIGITTILIIGGQIACRDTVHVAASAPRQEAALEPLPEAPDFTKAYARVGSPRIAVIVNRTLEGAGIAADAGPTAYLRPADERGRARVPVRDYWSSQQPARVRWQDQPGEARGADDRAYLRPGQYTEAQARAVNLAAVEAALESWLAPDANIRIVSANTIRRRLSDEKLRDLESGRPDVLAELAREADVLIQVQARPTRHVAGELEVSFTATAMNTRDGRLLSRAAVDYVGPVDGARAERVARALAGGIMEGLTQVWGLARAGADQQTPPAREPARVEQPARVAQPPAESVQPPRKVEQPPAESQTAVGDDLPPEPKVWNLPRLPVPATRPSK